MSTTKLEVGMVDDLCDGCDDFVEAAEPCIRRIANGLPLVLCASCVTAGAALIAQALLKLSMATPEETSHAAG